MIINKSEKFLTEQELIDLKKVDVSKTLMDQLRTVETEKEMMGFYDEMSAQLDVINAKITERYSKSFNGDKTAILKDIEETLSYITKEDFWEYQQSNPHKKIKKSFDGFCRFLWAVLSPQINAWIYWDFSSNEIDTIIEKKAAEFYTPTNKKKPPFMHLNTSTYSQIRQGNVINYFPTRIVEGRNAKKDRKGIRIKPKSANAQAIDYSCYIVSYDGIKKLAPDTKQLLFFLVKIFTESNMKTNPKMTLFLNDYMNRKKLKDRKSAIEALETNLKLITQSQLSYISTTGKGKRKKKNKIGELNLIDRWAWDNDNKKTAINFQFTVGFYEELQKTCIMQCPNLLWEINTRKNPASVDFLLKIAEHKNMNFNGNNADIIAVSTLLDATEFIPPVEEVRELDRNILDRIIRPFERDLNALDTALTWCYCYPRTNGEEVPKDKLSDMDFATFQNLCIKISWIDYPRISEKAEKNKTEQNTP